jgi:hypothetical protein
MTLPLALNAARYHPRREMSRDDEVNPTASAHVLGAPAELETDLSKLERAGVVVRHHVVHDGVQCVKERGARRGAVLETDLDGAQHEQHVEVRIRLKRRGDGSGDGVDQRELFRVRHERQVAQRGHVARPERLLIRSERGADGRSQARRVAWIGHLLAEQRQRLQAHLNRLLQLPVIGQQIRFQVACRDAFESAPRVLLDGLNQRERCFAAPRHVMALDGHQMRGQAGLVVRLPGCRAEQLEAERRKLECGLVRRGRLGALRRSQVESCEAQPLLALELLASSVEVSDDFEQLVVGRSCRAAGIEQQPPDPQVHSGALPFGDGGVSRLLHAVVCETVARLDARPRGIQQIGKDAMVAIQRHDETTADRSLKPSDDVARFLLRDDPQGREPKCVSDARGEWKKLASARLEMAEPVDHQIDDVVCRHQRGDRLEVPMKAALTLEREAALGLQTLQKLRHEEGIAGRLLVDQPCQRFDGLAAARQRVRDEVLDISAGERPDLDAMNGQPTLERLQALREGMHGVDLFVSVVADHEQAFLLPRREHLPQHR